MAWKQIIMYNKVAQTICVWRFWMLNKYTFLIDNLSHMQDMIIQIINLSVFCFFYIYRIEFFCKAKFNFQVNLIIFIFEKHLSHLAY